MLQVVREAICNNLLSKLAGDCFIKLYALRKRRKKIFGKLSQICTVWVAWTTRTTLWPPPALGVGVLEQNVSYNLQGVDVVLDAKFEHL